MIKIMCEIIILMCNMLLAITWMTNDSNNKYFLVIF
jgi:hypothetical protein